MSLLSVRQQARQMRMNAQRQRRVALAAVERCRAMFPRPEARAVDGPFDPESVVRRVEDAARAGAELAESVAPNLERLAAGYRRMAQATRDPARAEKLREYAARADEHATRERAEAVWHWTVVQDHRDRHHPLINHAAPKPNTRAE
jgi:hypothetical protein